MPFVNDEFDVNNPNPKRSTSVYEVGEEQAYINKKLPDMRINRKTGEVVRMNPKIGMSFPQMTDEEWARLMSK